jgi:hypothetical protein
MERDALFPDLPEACQGKHLKTAAVSQDRAVPEHEFMKTSHFVHDIVAGAKMQVIGVAESHLGADRTQIFGGKAAFDRCRGGNIHKARRLDGTVHRLETRTLGHAFRMQQCVSAAERDFGCFAVRGFTHL